MGRGPEGTLIATLSFDISMSLDGYVTGPDVTADEVMGKHGARLHVWAMRRPSRRNARLLEESVAEAGAFICGRRTYDLSLRWWGADGPTGAARLPTVVVTHRMPAAPPGAGVYHFMLGGISAAVDRARELADGRSVAIMSADIGRQCLLAGLVDEVSVHLVPVLLGGGTRLFEVVGGALVDLDTPTVVETDEVTHLRFAVRGRPREP